MDRLTITKFTAAQFVDRVHALASKYQTDWLDLHAKVKKGEHPMSPTDRDDFDFLCVAFRDRLERR